MVFLDTNIWVELLAAATPEKDYQKHQAVSASNLLKELKETAQDIVTCKEQIIEMFQAIMKVQLKTFNRACKERGKQGIGSVKEFRKSKEFQNAIVVCNQAYDSICDLAKIDNEFTYDVKSVLSKIDKADLNDVMYYQYCKQNGIPLYTFDKDMLNLDDSMNYHVVEVL